MFKYSSLRFFIFIPIVLSITSLSLRYANRNQLRVNYGSRSIPLYSSSVASYENPDVSAHENAAAATLMKSIPNRMNLLRFCLPTLAIWLLQPILSLIDSSIVGISSTSSVDSVLELASLGPGIIWCDGTAYLLQFLGMATTNLYGTAIGEGDPKKSAAVLSQAGTIALFLGVLLGIGQYVFARPALNALCGPSAAQITPIAMKYVSTRAFGAPIAMLTIVAQAAFLVERDAITPLRAVLWGCGANLMGDLILVLGLKQGVTGAAIATMASQVVCGFYLFGVAFMRLQKNMNIELDGTDTRKVSLKRVLNRLKLLYRKPGTADIGKFAAFAGPIMLVLFMKQALWCYATVCAASHGAVALAAHQVVINMLLFFCNFGDAMSQTVQTFLPGVLAFRYKPPKSVTDAYSSMESVTTSDNETVRKTSDNNEANSESENAVLPLETDSNVEVNLTPVRSLPTYILASATTLLHRILSIGLAAGLSNILVSSTLPIFAPQLFTKNLDVIGTMKSILPFLSACVLPHCLMSAFEGILVSSGDALYMSLGYVFSGLVFVGTQTLVSKRGGGLVGVWATLAFYQWIRLAVFGVKVWFKFFRPIDRKKVKTT
mmetsp:Transcript_33765/g.34401  ORF Transcript_33765/g.34401 Transcript_33765/m.34401 type:complete len:603 (+) Transcript_33765:122-1930(+)|eukprot:CAMPEP_0182430270 /NCGR_PEP_ID=MMETSP1167-20130531/38983_1 /TAXON_ID=2988 /ORGANISM="Mallomonas Sp, Strain CCMP3275" /LENGTH=602 /DNA_ID=CAMNT_0024615181 /DNA_START=42 /DNA_END=1850 /DNA_ORIENTATION=-